MPWLDPKDKELMQQYRNVFSSKEGPIVLAHMLTELGVFNQDHEDDHALRQYGARLMFMLGGGPVEMTSIKALIGQLVGQPLPEDKKEE